MEEENQEVKKFITFGELFKKSFDYSIKLFPKTFGILVIFWISTIVCFSGEAAFVPLLQKTSNSGFLIIRALLPLLICAAGFCFMIWSYASLLAVIVNMETEVKIKETIKDSRKMVLPLLSVCIWTSLIVVGGIFCLIIPGILFAVWFSLVPFPLFCENMRGRKALLRSKYLIKGYWWNVFGKLLILIVVALIFFIAIGFLEEKLPDFNLLWSIFSIVLIIIFCPLFLLIFLFLIYKDLSVIKGPMPENYAGFPENWAGIVFSLLGIIHIVGYLGNLYHKVGLL